MITKTLPVYRGPRCFCGAARRPQLRTCVKCHARDRWQRRAQNSRRIGRTFVRPATPAAPAAVARFAVVGS